MDTGLLIALAAAAVAGGRVVAPVALRPAAALGGAACNVLAVDTPARALGIARPIPELTEYPAGAVEFVHGGAGKLMAETPARFDLIVVDPPPLARSRSDAGLVEAAAGRGRHGARARRARAPQGRRPGSGIPGDQPEGLDLRSRSDRGVPVGGPAGGPRQPACGRDHDGDCDPNCRAMGRRGRLAGPPARRRAQSAGRQSRARGAARRVRGGDLALSRSTRRPRGLMRRSRRRISGHMSSWPTRSA